eukprot:jgi/Ulvmu1/2527/UM138_0032.1
MILPQKLLPREASDARLMHAGSSPSSNALRSPLTRSSHAAGSGDRGSMRRASHDGSGTDADAVASGRSPPWRQGSAGAGGLLQERSSSASPVSMAEAWGLSMTPEGSTGERMLPTLPSVSEARGAEDGAGEGSTEEDEEPAARLAGGPDAAAGQSEQHSGLHRVSGATPEPPLLEPSLSTEPLVAVAEESSGGTDDSGGAL